MKENKHISLPIVRYRWEGEEESEESVIKRLITGEEEDISELPTEICYFYKIDAVCPYFEDNTHCEVHIGNTTFIVREPIEEVLRKADTLK